MEKGIITTPGKIVVKSNEFSYNGLNSSDIKFLTLYWDRIAIPESKIISFGFPYREDLIDCDIITSLHVADNFDSTTSGEISRNIINTQYDFFNLVNKDPNIDWSIHQSGSEMIDDKSNLLIPSIHEQEIIKFTLRNCLPIPNEDIPLCDILEFKEKRKDDLEYLHGHIDNIYQEILSAGDTNLANKTALRDLKNNISDIRKVSLESFSTIKNMDLTALQATTISVAAIAGHQTLEIIGGAIAGAVGGALLCETSTKMISTRINHRKKFKYLSHASRDRIIGEI